LVDAGLPLLRGLRVLEKQGAQRHPQGIIGELALSIEGGSTFPKAWLNIPRFSTGSLSTWFKAGELGGVLEVVLNRLSEFMEKAQKIKGKVIAAMFYPVRRAWSPPHFDHPDGEGRAFRSNRVRRHVGRLTVARFHPPRLGISEMIKDHHRLYAGYSGRIRGDL
jgi:hypothetical protein